MKMMASRPITLCQIDGETVGKVTDFIFLGSIHGLARLSGGGNGTPLQYSCQDAHGQRGLGSYSPWGHRAGHA